MVKLHWKQRSKLDPRTPPIQGSIHLIESHLFWLLCFLLAPSYLPFLTVQWAIFKKKDGEWSDNA